MISLLDRPHAEARALMATGAPVYLTVNPVEYHGPHLSLHNDRLVSEGLARDLHARLAERHPDRPFLVAADLELGYEPCPGQGTRVVDYAAARALVLEACRALAELGARRVVLLTFHGAPLHNLVLQAAVERLAVAGVRAVAPFHLVLQGMLEVTAERFTEAFAHVPPAEREAAMGDFSADFHAGFFETSVALHYAPDAVAPLHRALPPCPAIRPAAHLAAAAAVARRAGLARLARELDFAALGAGWYALRPFPGYTGRPHLASAAAGAVFARAMVDAFAPVVDDVLEGRAPAPRPIFAWLERASLGGRIGGVALPPLGAMQTFPALTTAR